MGMYDTMNQAPTPQGQVANGSSFAQKQQMRANPMMRNRAAMGGTPTMGASIGQPNTSQRPNPMTGARPMMNSIAQNAGQGGSRSMIQNKLRAQQQESLATPPPAQPSRPQYGLQDVASRVESERNPAPAPQMSPMQAAMEQMRGYEGPDLGSQDPRELARVAQQNQSTPQVSNLYGSPDGQGQTQLYGSSPLQETTMQNPPYGGESSKNMGFQSMMESMNAQRPDVMPRGLGPSYS